MAESDVDIASLTEAQQLALQQYTAVTDQDLSAAVPLLQRCEWNVQIAISRFFDGEPAPLPPEEQGPPPPQPTRQHDTIANSFTSPYSPASRRPTHTPAPRIVPTPTDQLNQQAPLILSFLFTPVNFLYNLLTRAFTFFSRLFPFLPRLLSRFTTRGPGQTRSRFTTSQRRPLGPQDTTSRFLREFEEEYGQHSLPLLDTSYARAFDTAKRDLKFLLVVPISPEHDDTSPFVRKILLSTPVTSFLNNASNNILLWSGTTADSETFQVASGLNLTTFPSVALIAHTPSVSSTAMSVLLRLQPRTALATSTKAFQSPENFLTVLQAAITQHGGELNRVRNQRAEQQASRNILEQQNSAYERSLAQDRERVRGRREAEAAAQREEEETRRREAEAEKMELERRDRQERYERGLKAWRRWRRSRLMPEPEASEKEVVRVSLRLLGGERVVRRLKGEAPLEELYAFVECHEGEGGGQGAEDSEKAEDDDEKSTPQQRPSDFKHAYGFRLVSPMPREVYALEDGGTVRERIGRSGNLIVERIEDDEDVGGEDST